jgi:hypothetical protein
VSGKEEERGPGGMEAIPDEPLGDSEEPGGMSGIPEADPPVREPRETKDAD